MKLVIVYIINCLEDSCKIEKSRIIGNPRKKGIYLDSNSQSVEKNVWGFWDSENNQIRRSRKFK